MGYWSEKNVLCIGDSMTSAGGWQAELARELSCNVRTHANGGIGLIDMVDGQEGTTDADVMYDPTTDVCGKLGRLTVERVAWADLIILCGPFNERHVEYGERGDTYPEKNTLWAKYSYVLDRIFALLDEAGRLDCRVALVTPHCVGCYDWIPVDGYSEFPEGSDRTLETMAGVICDIAGSYHLPCYDAWHSSGIGRFTWKKFCHSPVVMDESYDPAKKYDAPYPMFADQVHMNEAGHARLGHCIAGFVETI